MSQKKRAATPINLYTLLEGILLCCFAAFLVFLLRKEPNTTHTAAEIAQALEPRLDLSIQQEAADQDVKRVFGLDAADYDGIVYYAPVGEMNVCELLLVKLKDDAQAETVTAAMEARLSAQRQNFDGYGTNQTALLNAALVDTAGGCVLYVVAADPQAVDDAFHEAL